MANTIVLRRSATQGASPTTGQLSLGEVAINTFDGRVYIKKDNGSASIVRLAGVNDTNTYTKAQAGSIVSLTDQANIATDLSLGNNFEVILAGNRTLDNPTNITAGQVGSIFIVQDATGSRTLSWGNYWMFPGGTAPTLSTAANSQDRVDFIVKSSTEIHAQFAGAFS